MDIITPSISQYLQRLSPSTDPVLEKMEELAERTNFPIVGPQVGALLGLLTRSLNAQRIFEVGSGFGYSALWFARHSSDTTAITCTEFKEVNVERGMRFLKEAGLADRVRYHQGDGIALLQEETQIFDIIFNDADKQQYPLVLETALPKLRTGGLLITDNALWKGKVAGDHRDDATQGVHTYNQHIMTNPTLLSVILPIRDGVAVSMKL